MALAVRHSRPRTRAVQFFYHSFCFFVLYFKVKVNLRCVGSPGCKGGSGTGAKERVSHGGTRRSANARAVAVRAPAACRTWPGRPSGGATALVCAALLAGVPTPARARARGARASPVDCVPAPGNGPCRRSCRDLVTRPARCREAFSCYAEPHLPPGQGSITTRELGQLLRALGKNPTQDELSKLFQKVDPQQEGAVKFDTFVNCMLEPMKQPGAPVRRAACALHPARAAAVTALFRLLHAKPARSRSPCPCPRAADAPLSAESENDILESFRAFDYQGAGTITVSEFQTVMRNYGEALSVRFLLLAPSCPLLSLRLCVFLGLQSFCLCQSCPSPCPTPPPPCFSGSSLAVWASPPPSVPEFLTDNRRCNGRTMRWMKS